MTQRIENQNALYHSKMYITSVQPKLENLIKHPPCTNQTQAANLSQEPAGLIKFTK